MAEQYLSTLSYKLSLIKDFWMERLCDVSKNEYHPTKNPEGLIDMGVVINQLMEKEWEQRLNQPGSFKFIPSRHQHYLSTVGTHVIEDLKEAVAGFYNRHFKPQNLVQSSEIHVVNGTASGLSSLSYTLFDPEDCFITPAPVYHRMKYDMTDRGDGRMITFQMEEKSDTDGLPFTLCPIALETKISDLVTSGVPLKGFVLINPQNPLGDVYGPKLLMDILEICAKYKLHAIFIEVYAFSVFDPKTEFRSVISLRDVPDPNRTHHIWSFSKDLGLAGIRCGFIHTRNPSVSAALHRLTMLHSLPLVVQDQCAAILNDEGWIDDFYIPLSQQRLLQQYESATSILSHFGIHVRPAKSGCFLWIDLRRYLTENTKEAEIDLYWKLFNAGVNIAPGSLFYCRSPGWFRIIFTIQEEYFRIGIERMASALNSTKL